jgi:hypothetical protein
MQSMPITTSVLISNPAHDDYVIKLAIDLRQIGGFFRVFQIPPSIQLTGATIAKKWQKWH